MLCAPTAVLLVSLAFARVPSAVLTVPLAWLSIPTASAPCPLAVTSAPQASAVGSLVAPCALPVPASPQTKADAVFDAVGAPEWSFEGLLVRHNPRHRWRYFRDMTRNEALVFKTNDSDPREPHHVPHSAFDDPSCTAGVPPRMSVEARAIAFWF